jgi:hypothetical protein
MNLSPFSGSDDEDGGTFDAYDEFVPAHLPEPGPFLEGHDVLTGEAHVDVHRTARDVFEERGVYDVTFGYNLARLNLDGRHPDAGFRYARDADDPSTLRAEFTPTTEFCPQSDTLSKGSFHAWNGLDGKHEFDLVRVRVHQSHRESGSVNEALSRLEAAHRGGEEGTRAPATDEGPATDESGNGPATPF